MSDRVFTITALAMFGAGSLVDVVAPNFVIMLVGRIMQAVSGGLLIPQLQTIAMTRFPENRRATATGIGGIGLGLAPNVGPAIGGAMEAAFGWRSFSVLMAALSVVLIALTLLFAKNVNTGNDSARFEQLSFIYSTVGFGGVLLGLSQASSVGLASPLVWGPLIVGAAFLVLFVRHGGHGVLGHGVHGGFAERRLSRRIVREPSTALPGFVGILRPFGRGTPRVHGNAPAVSLKARRVDPTSATLFRQLIFQPPPLLQHRMPHDSAAVQRRSAIRCPPAIIALFDHRLFSRGFS